MSDRLAHTLLLRALLLAAMGPCFALSAAAQQAPTEEAPAESAAVQTLSLREALLRASRAAPQVLAAFARADAARAQLRVASAALYPSVSASVSANVGVANGGGVSDASGAGGASASVTAPRKTSACVTTCGTMPMRSETPGSPIFTGRPSFVQKSPTW